MTWARAPLPIVVCQLAGRSAAALASFSVHLYSRNAIRLRGRAGVPQHASGPRARGAEALQLLLQRFTVALRWTP